MLFSKSAVLIPLDFGSNAAYALQNNSVMKAEGIREGCTQIYSLKKSAAYAKLNFMLSHYIIYTI